MIFGERLFGGIDELKSLKPMVQYLGSPPSDLLDRCKNADDFFDKQGGCPVYRDPPNVGY